jgi:hypothetical protein
MARALGDLGLQGHAFAEGGRHRQARHLDQGPVAAGSDERIAHGFVRRRHCCLFPIGVMSERWRHGAQAAPDLPSRYIRAETVGYPSKRIGLLPTTGHETWQ